MVLGWNMKTRWAVKPIKTQEKKNMNLSFVIYMRIPIAGMDGFIPRTDVCGCTINLERRAFQRRCKMHWTS